jgi:hypothetical protein
MYVDDLGCIDRLPLSTAGPLARAAPREFLSGVTRLLAARSLTFSQLFASYDTADEGRLGLPELEALSRDAIGPSGGPAARYFMVRPGGGVGGLGRAPLCQVRLQATGRAVADTAPAPAPPLPHGRR